MKVVIVTSNYPPAVGGIATLNAALAASLAALPAVSSLTVFAFKSPKRSRTREGVIAVRRSPAIGIVGLVFELLLSREFLRADVVHATNVFPVGFAAVLLGRLLGKRTVVSFHGTDMLAREGSRLTKRAKRFAVLRADTAVALSVSTRREVAALLGVSEERFPVVYPPLPPLFPPDPSAAAAVRAAAGASETDVIVLAVAHLVRRKGIRDLIEAVARLPASVKLVVVGKGPEEGSLRELAAARLPGRAHFAGRVPDTTPYYGAADIFSLPSYFLREEGDIEGLGIVYLEAQARGIPVVGTRSGGIPEAIDDGRSGFVVAERDIAALAEKLGELARDPSLRRRMGERGRSFVAERFAPERIARAYLSVYRGDDAAR